MQVNHLPSLNRPLLNLICATTPPHINNWNSEEGNYSRVIATAVVDMGRGMKREGVHSWWISHSSSWLRLFLPTTFKPTAGPKICCISQWIPRALLGSPPHNQHLSIKSLWKKIQNEKGKNMSVYLSCEISLTPLQFGIVPKQQRGLATA